MITFVRGTQGDRPTISARSTFVVGARTIDVIVPLGRWPADAGDPAGPSGLSSVPAVVISRSDLATITEAGVRRASRGLPTQRFSPDPTLGLTLLAAVEGGVEALLGKGGEAELRLLRALGGRPIAALPLEHPARLEELLGGLDVDVHVALPSVEGPLRARVRELVRPLALETTHHVVEVDPRPAFAELDASTDGADLDHLAAAAAGVLAGRLAAANRRWRRERAP
jgi:hypothetical protein